MIQFILPFTHLPRPDHDVVRPIVIGGRTHPVRFVRHPGARRYILTVQDDGTLRVTIPRGGSERAARAFAMRQAAWIERQRYLRAKQRLDRSWKDGTVVWLRGQLVTISLQDDHSARIASVGGERVRVPQEAIDLRPWVQRHLRRLAVRELAPRLHRLAAKHGLAVSRVTVRNQRSRWGACSRNGHITLNWRLVQMPESVRDYILLHELMHLRVASHSTRFWKAVEQVCPGWREARGWLKAHQDELA